MEGSSAPMVWAGIIQTSAFFWGLSWALEIEMALATFSRLRWMDGEPGARWPLSLYLVISLSIFT